MGKPKKKKRKLSAYNKHMSREMKKGRTFKQAVASWKPGSKKSSPKKKTGKSNPKGGTRRMAKNSFNMSKIYGLARKAALAAPLVARAMGPGTMESKVDGIVADYTGYAMGQQDWKWERLMRGWMPYVATSFVTKLIPALNKIVRGLF